MSTITETIEFYTRTRTVYGTTRQQNRFGWYLDSEDFTLEYMDTVSVPELGGDYFSILGFESHLGEEFARVARRGGDGYAYIVPIRDLIPHCLTTVVFAA